MPRSLLSPARNQIPRLDGYTRTVDHTPVVDLRVMCFWWELGVRFIAPDAVYTATGRWETVSGLPMKPPTHWKYKGGPAGGRALIGGVVTS
jgi:hypothetical protein